MKRYVNYLNGVEPAPDLTERLHNLKPQKSRLPLAIACGAAAALMLAAGLGLALRHAPAPIVRENSPAATGAEELGKPDIALVPSGGEENYETLPGYEIDDGELVTYFVLPHLEIGDATGLPSVAMDYSLCPQGGYERTLTEEDAAALFDTALYQEHLGIPASAVLSGHVFFTPQDEASGLILYWTEGDMIRACYEVLRGGNVPSCVVCPDQYGVTEVVGVQVTTLALPDSIEVKLYFNGFGYKATLYGDNCEELAARFVRLVLSSPSSLDSIA